MFVIIIPFKNVKRKIFKNVDLHSLCTNGSEIHLQEISKKKNTNKKASKIMYKINIMVTKSKLTGNENIIY